MRSLLGSKTLIALLVLLVVLVPLLHYFLPQVDVVRAVGGEVRREDTTEADTGAPLTRDVYFVQTQTLAGRPSVYRNEDTWLYFKFDSADLQAEVLALANEQQVMAVRHYGWRIRFLSWFPNAVSVWPVEEDYRHLPIFNIVVLGALALLALLGVRRLSTAEARRETRRAEAEAARQRAAAAEETRRREAAEAEAAAARAREAEARRDVDDFLNSPGSGDK